MEEKTLVSVIMPVYNTERHLPEAIESILNQTYTNFEFLIQDDGSTDNSPKIIQKYASQDSRIIPIISHDNIGISDTLNNLVIKAKGEYVVRMDSDDISLPDRIHSQVEFLNKNFDVAILGGSTVIINNEGLEIDINRANVSSAFLYWKSYFTCPLSHPTVAFRRMVVIESGMYDPKMFFAEDFDLWTRVLKRHKISNITELLLKYRYHESSISNSNKVIQRGTSINIIRRTWSEFINEELDFQIAFFFENFHRGYEGLNPNYAFKASQLLMRLYVHTKNKYGLLDETVKRDFFNKVLYLLTLSKRINILDSFKILQILIRYTFFDFFKFIAKKVKVSKH